MVRAILSLPLINTTSFYLCDLLWGGQFQPIRCPIFSFQLAYHVSQSDIPIQTTGALTYILLIFIIYQLASGDVIIVHCLIKTDSGYNLFIPPQILFLIVPKQVSSYLHEVSTSFPFSVSSTLHSSKYSKSKYQT